MNDMHWLRLKNGHYINLAYVMHVEPIGRRALPYVTFAGGMSEDMYGLTIEGDDAVHLEQRLASLAEIADVETAVRLANAPSSLR
jgi:hypothetical protein